LNVAKHVSVAAQEYDAVASRIRPIPFQLVARDFNFRSGLDVRPSSRLIGPVVGDDRVGFAVADWTSSAQ